MALDQSQQRMLVEWMDSKKIRTDCPACGTPDSWTPGDIVAAPISRPDGLHVGREVNPMVEIICGNCGHIRFFAALPIGIYKKERRGKEHCDAGSRAGAGENKNSKPYTISL